jgi:hypothetical protein
MRIRNGFITGIGFMLKECMVRVKRSMACGGQYGRGLANVAIQVYLIAAVINLKRLAKALSPRPDDGDWYLIIRNRLGAVIKQFFGDWVEKLYSTLFCTA